MKKPPMKCENNISFLQNLPRHKVLRPAENGTAGYRLSREVQHPNLPSSMQRVMNVCQHWEPMVRILCHVLMLESAEDATRFRLRSFAAMLTSCCSPEVSGACNVPGLHLLEVKGFAAKLGVSCRYIDILYIDILYCMFVSDRSITREFCNPDFASLGTWRQNCGCRRGCHPSRCVSVWHAATGGPRP